MIHTRKAWNSLELQCIGVLEDEDHLEKFWSSNYKVESGLFDHAYEGFPHIAYGTHVSHMCVHAL